MWKVAIQENLSGRQIEVDDIQAVLDRTDSTQGTAVSGT
jgi:hypothetical protein